MTNNIYEELGIDLNRLRRDYRKYPLNITKKGIISYIEKPTNEELLYLYIEKNITLIDLQHIFNVSEAVCSRWLKLYGIKKPKELYQINTKNTILLKYGVDNVSKLEDIKTKKKETCIKHFGIDSYSKTAEYIKRSKQTKLEKYGNENYNNIKKIQSTLQERYGVTAPLQDKKIKEKQEKTTEERYGNKYYTRTNEYKEKSRKTCLEKYGCTNIFQLKETKDKSKQTCLERYGHEYYTQTEEYRKRANITYKKNKSFTKSKPEEEIYRLLRLKFKKVYRQYYSDKYPFPCDFYVQDIDLYIEYQGFYMHNYTPFTGTPEQLAKVEYWKKKASKQYEKAIQTWTIKDPLKRKTAKDNGLNWIEFFTISEFMVWYDSIPQS